MEAKNRQEIQKKTIQFWCLFFILMAVTTVAIYSFVWATFKQKAAYVERLQEYRQVINSQLVIQQKVDSLYYYMSNLDANKVDNYLFLEGVISATKANALACTNADSSQKFDAYNFLLSNINNQALTKDTIIKVSAKEYAVKNDLFNCISKNANIRTALSHQQRALSN